jgi:hypothetical protein
LLLTLLALSIRISFASMVLAIVPVPPFAFHLLSIFRASGRFFWPVYYLLMLAAVVGAAAVFQSRVMSRAFLAACLFLQVADTAGFAAGLAQESRVTVSDPLRSPEWLALGNIARHLVVLPAEQCDKSGSLSARENWYWLARLAARENLTLNSAYAARISARSYAYNCTELPHQVARGILASQTVYVLDNTFAQLATKKNRALRCHSVDGFNLCTQQPLPVPRPFG